MRLVNTHTHLLNRLKVAQKHESINDNKVEGSNLDLTIARRRDAKLFSLFLRFPVGLEEFELVRNF